MDTNNIKWWYFSSFSNYGEANLDSGYFAPFDHTSKFFLSEKQMKRFVEFEDEYWIMFNKLKELGELDKLANEKENKFNDYKTARDWKRKK